VKTWQEAARGIEPWAGAHVIEDATGNPLVLTMLLLDTRRCVAALSGEYIGVLSLDHVTPDLADPDTRAAFDRRLALRLGAPDREGNSVYVVGSTLRVMCSEHVTMCDNSIQMRGYECKRVRVDTDDPLLARALAWRSVPDSSTPEAP
jgi:hypothetical protein